MLEFVEHCRVSSLTEPLPQDPPNQQVVPHPRNHAMAHCQLVPVLSQYLLMTIGAMFPNHRRQPLLHLVLKSQVTVSQLKRKNQIPLSTQLSWPWKGKSGLCSTYIDSGLTRI